MKNLSFATYEEHLQHRIDRSYELITVQAKFLREADIAFHKAAHKTYQEALALYREHQRPDERKYFDHEVTSMATAGRKNTDKMFFPCIMYSTEEIQRILSLPVWRQYLRILFVLSFRWLKPSIRARLKIR
jgi:hypothetical protein